MRRLVALAVAAALVTTGDQAHAAAPPTIIAHRGAGGTGIENTIEAFTTSPATTWEGDLRWAGSGTPVMLHDGDLGVFGCPAIQIVTVSATRARECGPLATLAQVVTEMKARPGVRLWLELKTPPTPDQWTLLDRRLADVKSRTVIEAFGPVRLEKASARGYSTAYLTWTATTVLPKGTDWYAPVWTTLTAGQVGYFHARSVKVAVWTPDPPDWPSGVDAIITNHP